MGIQDLKALKRAYSKLVESTEAGDTWIDRIVACAMEYDPEDDRPALVIGRIINRRTGEARTQIDVLDNERSSVELDHDEDITVHVFVYCSALLQPWLKQRSGGSD